MAPARAPRVSDAVRGLARFAREGARLLAPVPARCAPPAGGTTLAPCPSRICLSVVRSRLLLLLDDMANLWIVHRDPRWRDALRRLAGSIELLVGAPTDSARFDVAPPPRAVLLGVAGDFEAELEFAHRHADRLGATLWVLLARERDRAEVERLFEGLPCAVVALASDATALRARLVAALARRSAAVLAARARRDALSQRFALWTGDLDLPALLAASDPARAHLPLLVRGEAGTGRGMVARYLHQATSATAFVALRGAPDFDPADALRRLERETRALAPGTGIAVCIEDVDRIEPAAQRTLRDWVENGLPIGRARVRWMATAAGARPDEDALDATLAQALAGHEIALAPLRERPAAIDALIAASGRSFTPEAVKHLHAHPWPGNLRELDAVLRRTLALKSSDPIAPDDLRFDPALLLDEGDLPPAPLAAPAPSPPRQRPPAESPATTAPVPRASTQEPARDAASGGFARSEPQAGEVERAGTTGQPDRPHRLDDAGASDPGPIHRLSNAIAHEVGNPLVGIRTYASLLPSRFDDAEFRARFAERVETDTRRIEAVIETLAQLGGFATPQRASVDVSALLAAILERARPRIRERRLVVLEELDRAHPCALGDAQQLGFAFELLIDGALAWVPARGDLYVSTRRRVDERGATLRVELRMRGATDGLGFGEQTLAVAVADAVVRAHAGSLESTTGAGGESSVRIDLPASDAET